MINKEYYNNLVKELNNLDFKHKDNLEVFRKQFDNGNFREAYLTLSNYIEQEKVNSESLQKAMNDFYWYYVN